MSFGNSFGDYKIVNVLLYRVPDILNSYGYFFLVISIEKVMTILVWRHIIFFFYIITGPFFFYFRIQYILISNFLHKN